MHFISFLHKFPKFKRFPLQGYWQNIVILSDTRSQSHTSLIAITKEARTAERRTALSAAVTDVKCPSSEQMCFLPDADSLKMEKPPSFVAIDTERSDSYKSECSCGDLEGSNSDDSDITLNDIESYACFENDHVSVCSDSEPPKKLRRRLLPPVKKQKYDYVQSKVKQYVKSKIVH